MKILTAETAGFCFGVKRAVETAEKEAEKSGRVYTYGPIIHNDQVVEDLRKKGVGIVETREEIEELGRNSTPSDPVSIIIRSHGAGKEIYELCEKNGLRIVDATCPFVKKIHRIVREEHEKGRRIIIVGNRDHPEVTGIKGWAGEDAVVISGLEELEKTRFMPGIAYSLVAQTTYNYGKFKEIIEKSKKLKYDITCFNTVCNATQERQSEAEEIASKADAMIVIGGKSSSNTRKLYDICSEKCTRTYLIQTYGDLDRESLRGLECIGITAGASTPKHIIEEVQNNVRNEF